MVQWLSGDQVQPIATAPWLPPVKAWPGVAWARNVCSKKQQVTMSNSSEKFFHARKSEQRIERLNKELEEARYVTTKLMQLMDESKKVHSPPLPHYPNNYVGGTPVPQAVTQGC